MGRISTLIAGSTGLKVTYAGFAAYGLYTLAKFFTIAAEDSVPMVLFAAIGNLGLLSGIISMVVTGIRRGRQGGRKWLWSLWACIGCLPFSVPIFLALLATAGGIEGPKVQPQRPTEQEKLKIRIEEIKAKSPNSPALPTLTRIYAEDRFRYKGEIIEYIDKEFKTIKYEPTEKLKKEREFWVTLPERAKAARKERQTEGAVAFSILLLSALAGFFSRIDRTSNTPLEPSR